MNCSTELCRAHVEEILTHAGTAAFSVCRDFHDLVLRQDQPSCSENESDEAHSLENVILHLSDTLSRRAIRGVEPPAARPWISIAVQEVVEYAYAWYCRLSGDGTAVCLTWTPRSPQFLSPCPKTDGKTLGQARLDDLQGELAAQGIGLT